MTELSPFYAMKIGAQAFALQESGRQVFHMEYGQPSAPIPDRVKKAAQDCIGNDAPGYWESVPLKQRIAASYADLYGASVDPKQVFLMCGASPALVLALSSQFKPGDRIAMGRPGYVAYRNVVKGLHLTPVEISCGPETGFQLTAAHLREMDEAPAGVIIASPANPTGSIIPPSELEAIIDVCQKRDIQIVSDEIYHRLTYGEAAMSVAAYTSDAMIVNSFSKYFLMPGWRLGWLIVPEAAIDRTTAYFGNFFLNAPSISQVAALAMMDETKALDAHVHTYARNRERLLEALPTLGLSEIAPPQGAFYIYANISEFTDDSFAFCQRLLAETGVATAPGVDFDPVNGNQFMRFSFAVSEAEVEQALDLLVPWFSEQTVK